MKRVLHLFSEEPYRLFFPMGILMGLSGVSHWIFYAVGHVPNYSGTLHASIQLELYMTSFVVGFLTTAVPKFSDSFPARPWEVAALLAGFAATAGFLLTANFLGAYASFAVILLTLLVFIVRRFLKRRVQYPPVEFVWLPMAALSAIAACGLFLGVQAGLFPVQALAYAKPLWTQAYMLAIILGVGCFLGPRLMGSRELPRPETIRQSLSAFRMQQVAVQLAGATVFFASFVIEGSGHRVEAYFLRAFIVTFLFIRANALILKPPASSLLARLVSLSFWSIVAGLWLCAFFPARYLEAAHFIFIGGFSLMTFAVSTMVLYSHAGRGEQTAGSPLILRVIAFFVPLALAVRLTAVFFPEHYFTLLAAAASFWIVAGLAWFALALQMAVKSPSVRLQGQERC